MATENNKSTRTDQNESKSLLSLILNKVWNFFSSLILTIVLFIVLAITSIFGTFIEQGKSIETYMMTYGDFWGRFIIAADLDEMYYSWWFVSLLCTMVVHIIVCTFERFPPKWKSLLRHDKHFNALTPGRTHCSEEITATGTFENVKEDVYNFFKKKKYKLTVYDADKVIEDDVSSKKSGLYGFRGKIGRYGSDVIHISILIVLSGALVDSFTGYKDYRNLNVGDSLKVPDSSYVIHLDDFWLEYYDTGQVKQYKSVITVTENDEAILTKTIWVNEPLFYKGIRFYQSSYGQSWSKIKAAEMTLIDFESKEPVAKIEPFELLWGETREVPGTDFSMKIVGYVSDFAFDEQTGTVFSKSAEADNPAVELAFLRDDEVIDKRWVFHTFYPGIYPEGIGGTKFDVLFSGYKPIPFSGLSLNKSPGTNTVWYGTLIMGVGFYMAFFILYRRMWIYISEKDGVVSVHVGGLINKNKLGFERDFNSLIKEIKKLPSIGNK